MVRGWVAGFRRGRVIMPFDNSRRDWVVLALSLGLAAVFIYAGIEKIQDRLQFADTIAAFRILPAALINLIALGLPPFEIACGLLLLGRPTRRVGALAVALVCVLYLSVLSSALARGLTLDCGCFGTGTPSRPRMWLEVGLDFVLLGCALFVYIREIAPVPILPSNEVRPPATGQSAPIKGGINVT
jgi:uncharacterized membrane protein YphA (DoxX/SURF4 family)